MPPKIGRIVLKDKNQNNGNAIMKNKEVKAIKTSTDYSCKELCELLSEYILNNDVKIDYLVTPGGFLKFNFPTKYENHTLKEVDFEYDSVLKSLVDEAKKKAKKFISCINLNNTNNFFSKIKKMVIGMDAVNSFGVHIELALVVDSKGETLHWTGKSYPTKGQENKFIRIKNYSSHIYKSENNNILIMVCHDLNIYNKRAIKRSQFRKDIVNKFGNAINNNKINVILHLPHTIDHSGTWKNAWNQLVAITQPEIWTSSVYYKNWKNESPRSALDKVLKSTSSSDVEKFYNRQDKLYLLL